MQFSPISSNLSSIDSLSTAPTGATNRSSGSLMPSAIGSTEETSSVPSFGSTLANALQTVNEAMDGSKKATEGLMAGTVENVHDVTIAGAKAEVMMKLTTTIASKLAQATTQLFQMQV